MWALSRAMGISGCVYSNGINMSLRSWMAVGVVFRECGKVWSIFPSLSMLAAFVCVGFFGDWMGFKWCFALAPLVGSMVLYLERGCIKDIITLFRNKRSRKKESDGKSG
jgi:hypothetical protein